MTTKAVSATTFAQAINEAIAHGLVERVGGDRYRVTEKGRKAAEAMEAAGTVPETAEARKLEKMIAVIDYMERPNAASFTLCTLELVRLAETLNDIIKRHGLDEIGLTRVEIDWSSGEPVATITITQFDKDEEADTEILARYEGIKLGRKGNLRDRPWKKTLPT
jgi:hypothetical protein